MKDHPQVSQFFEHLEELTGEGLAALHQELGRLGTERRAHDEMRQRWRSLIRHELKLPAASQQHLKSRLRAITSEKLDFNVIGNDIHRPATTVSDSATFALQALANRHKLTGEEYQWFIGPYLAAGFPREIFYPEEG